MELTEKLSMKRMIEFMNNKFTGDEYVKASEIIEMLEVGIVENDAVIDDKQLDAITAQNNNRVNDCMALVMKLFNNGVIDMLQSIMLVRVIENVSLTDAKDIIIEWSRMNSAKPIECQHEWVAIVNGDIKCKHCSAVNPEPDPILEVYDKYKDTHTSPRYIPESWQAITKYAKARGKK